MKVLARILGSVLCALPAALLAGCGGKASKTVEVSIAPPRSLRGTAAAEVDWRHVATAEDRTRLRNWRQAWIDALAKAQGSAKAAVVASDSLLFDPDRALSGAMPPPGNYLCRVIKLGANGTAMHDVTTYPPVDCKVDDEGEVSSLYKVSGAQRPVGLLFPDSQARTIFLGTMVLGDETKPLSYGQDSNRDMAGYLERIGEKRWRLVLPYPRFESLLDVVEIVPAPKR
ncbi:MULTISPECIES: DUF4893 domain-containing protein [Sphingomonas]|uniref:DUF4893 domain-containing protein n=1 Tax=Sphingomonas echinoides TaxID=59803 RepID=A0ABU4PMV5_9SPHN|nr:DUF4893 domain-containing protein [Sphingomonas echinoides]MDX5985466.1 DUF4893 domain-containing protein [Sphingomonas echinoides]